MKWFRLAGLGRVALTVIAANQAAIIVCVLAGAKFTPVFGIIGITIFAYWDLFLLPKLLLAISDEHQRAQEENRQIMAAGFVFGMPLLWFAVPSGIHSSAQGLWGTSNMIFLGELGGTLLLYGRRGFSYYGFTRTKKPNDS
jgi:hypothetical protein